MCSYSMNSTASGWPREHGLDHLRPVTWPARSRALCIMSVTRSPGRTCPASSRGRTLDAEGQFELEHEKAPPEWRAKYWENASRPSVSIRDQCAWKSVHLARAEVSPAASQPVRVATGLLAIWQSTAWLGAEAGLFKKLGIDLTLPAIAVGGPRGRGGAHAGRLGVRPHGIGARRGRSPERSDVVILATPTSDISKSFVMARKEITDLSQLDGKRVGVLTQTGQTSVAARLTVEKTGATATYLPLITQQNFTRHWHPERSMQAHCRSIYALLVKFDMAGMPFQ
jgi:hypothetical protein